LLAKQTAQHDQVLELGVVKPGMEVVRCSPNAASRVAKFTFSGKQTKLNPGVWSPTCQGSAVPNMRCEFGRKKVFGT